MKISFNIHKIFKSAIAVSLSCLSLASCVQIEEEVNGVSGYLCAPSLDVDVTVDDLTQTKALDFLVETPSISDITFVVKDKNGTVKYDGKGLWDKLVLIAGPYSVEATYGSNGFGSAYFYAKTADDASITPGEEEKPVLELQLTNALVKVNVTEAFAGHFTLETVTLTSDSEEKVLSASQIADWYYVPSKTELAVKLTGKNSAGVQIEYNLPAFVPGAKTAYNIVCGESTTSIPTITLPDQSAGAWAGRLYVTPAGFENISAANQAKVVYEASKSGNWDDIISSEVIEGQYHVIKGLENGSTYYVRARIGNLYTADDQIKTVTVVENLSGTSVSSAHYNDGDGNLAGTNSTLSLGLTGVLKTLYDAGHIVVATSLKKGSTEVRTGSANGVMTASSGWPYLPQGTDYTLTVNHRLNNESATIPSTKTGFSSPAPSFNVNYTSYASYDKYLAGDVAAANGCVAETLYGVGAVWTISQDIISNANYADCVMSYELKFDGSVIDSNSDYTSNSCSVADRTGLSWSTHTVEVSVTFDNITVAPGAKEHQITGLPYNAAPPSKSGANPWNDNQGNNDWEDDCVKLYYSAGTYPRIISPAFHVPNDIKVSIYTKIYREYYWSGIAKGDIRVYQCNSSGGEENKLYKGELAREKTYEPSTPLSATMTSVRPAFYIQYDYMAATGKTNVYYFKVHYNSN